MTDELFQKEQHKYFKHSNKRWQNKAWTGLQSRICWRKQVTETNNEAWTGGKLENDGLTQVADELRLILNPTRIIPELGKKNLAPHTPLY